MEKIFLQSTNSMPNPPLLSKPLSQAYYQYRSFDHLYLFKIKGDEYFVLKIFNVSQRCLFKKVIRREIKGFDVTLVLEKNDFLSFIEALVQQQFLPKEYFPAIPMQTTLKDCLEAVSQMIQKFKPKVFAEGREIEKFSCCITQDIFTEPVMDEHGHTFEKKAIEDWLKKKNECPLTREPIHSLIPNLLVKQTIEEWQQRDPIPNFSLFQKENPKLAEISLQTAQLHIEEKEYDEALETYAKAFQYTKKWTDYCGVPILFEKMQKKENAILAYLYLALYQLEDGKTLEALSTLQRCEPSLATCPQVGLLLIKLNELICPEKASELALRLAKILSQQSSEQAIHIYQHLLTQRPDQLDLYSVLADLHKNPEEKAHILFIGACHAIRAGDYKTAEKLSQEATARSEDSFIDQLIVLDLITKQKGSFAMQEKLLSIAETFEKKGLFEQMLRAYKMLYQIRKTPEYCQKIIAAYEKLQKPKQQTIWYIEILSLFIERKDWPKANEIAQEALKRVNNEQSVSIYEKLEVVYTHWNGHELEDLWSKLGKAYETNGQIIAAEITYRKLVEKFHGFDQAIALAKILSQQGKIRDSVQIYYQASMEALLEESLERITLSLKEIKTIDPHMEQLDVNQRIHLLTQSHILNLSRELQSANQKIAALEQREGQRAEAKARKLAALNQRPRGGFGFTQPAPKTSFTFQPSTGL